VITDPKCGTEIDHGVLAVGYGKEGDQEYFIVKNSWGAQWGDNGYVKIGIAEGEGICGIQRQASQPETQNTAKQSDL
jgi:KDEL-tailed cysteine endopeptidase